MTSRVNAKACKRCGIGREEAGGLSRRGLCTACSTAGVANSIRSLTDRQGPAFDKWQAAMREAARRALAEAEPPAKKNTKRSTQARKTA